MILFIISQQLQQQNNKKSEKSVTFESLRSSPFKFINKSRIAKHIVKTNLF